MVVVPLAIIALWPLGRGAFLLALIAVVPLFPVTTIGPAMDAFGGNGDLLRIAFIGLMTGCLLLAHRGRIPQAPPRLRPLIGGLVLLAGLGAFAAVANAGPSQSVASLFGQLVGQPALFAVLLILMAAYLRGGELSRDRMLTAFSVGIALEAVVIAVELATGSAYDSLRGFTRAQGTVGADFISALGMVGFLVGFAEVARSERMRPIGLITIAASLVILTGAVARGGVIGVCIGGAYVLLSDPRLRRRALPVVAIVSLLVIGSLFTPAGHLWTDRLGTSTVKSFDRPATWVSGARIGIDHPLTGLAEQDIERALVDVRAYRQTPVGDSRVLPHNSWIIVLAEGGFAALVVLLAVTFFAIRAVRPPPGGRSTEERFYVAALIGMAAVSMINNVFRHPELMIPTLMLISLLACPLRPAPPAWSTPAPTMR